MGEKTEEKKTEIYERMFQLPSDTIVYLRLPNMTNGMQRGVITVNAKWEVRIDGHVFPREINAVTDLIAMLRGKGKHND